MRQVGSEAVRRCDAAKRLSHLHVFATLRRLLASSHLRDTATPLGCSLRLRVFATLRRCDASTPLVPSHLCDAATLRSLWGAPRVFATLRRCDAATLRRCAVGEHLVVRLKLRAAARFSAVAPWYLDASDAATLQPWGGWWVGLHAVVTSMYRLKLWGLDQIFIFANKQ